MQLIVHKIESLNTVIMTKIILGFVKNVVWWYEPVWKKVSFAIMEKNLVMTHVDVRKFRLHIHVFKFQK